MVDLRVWIGKVCATIVLEKKFYELLTKNFTLIGINMMIV